MRAQTEALPGHAASLQCIAAAFRDVELRRFATVLDHMSASLLVPSMPSLALVAGAGIEEAAHEGGSADAL